jgi:rubrerythrin
MRARITALGGTPTIDAAVPATPVKTTTENLLAAQAALNTLKDTDLPAWRRSAEAEGNRDAVTSLRWTRESTIEWGRFVKDAIDASPTSPSAKSPAEAAKKDFFISRTCGFPVEKLDFQKCPVCRSGRDDFEKVN